jgi:acetoin utilization protein AcuB
MSQTIAQVMTSSPLTINGRATMREALTIMESHGIRHLPVLHGGRLVGMVSDRDLRLIETLDGVDPEKLAVEEAMSQDVYAVESQTSLREVARTMAERKYGSAVVMEGAQVRGIFTTVDALRVLATLAP